MWKAHKLQDNTGALAREAFSIHVVEHCCKVISSRHPSGMFIFEVRGFGEKEPDCP